MFEQTGTAPLEFDPTNDNILDLGVTLSFRARLTPEDALSEIPMPNGYGIFPGGQGMFGLRQNNPVLSGGVAGAMIRLH